ncbi:TlpA family protein disulfide reductase, partial [Candidatus Woesearchaeota archaeon]|nr:TlpA family protein disulfide reductase [Candidatus Woesearchaeota archaeon]
MKGYAAIGIVAALMAVILASGCQKSPGEAQEKIAKTLAALQEGSGEINSKAPQFSLTATDGTTVSIGSYSDTGKPVYINFFTTWCPICVEEQPDLNKAATEVKDVQFIGVSIKEEAAAVDDYAKKLNVPYPVLADTNGSVSKKYFIIGQPVHFFIDSEGIIRNRITGPVNYELLASELSKLTGSTTDIKEAEKDEAKVTNGVKHTIPLDEIVEVLPQDRIP